MTNDKFEEGSGPVAARRPTLELLSQELLERIVAEALDVLSKVGVLVDDDEALGVLGDGGAGSP